jgi:hypothetical protein
MLDATTVLDILEREAQSIESRLGPQWTEFSRRVGDLTGQFKTIAGETDAQAASSYLELAVNDLLEICEDYPAVGELLDQGQGEFPALDLSSGGLMRPLPPSEANIFEVKEIANRYYSLLARLKEVADQAKEGPNDRRART